MPAASPHHDVSTVLRYHEETKHQVRRYARSLGYLDWATQPHPFRHYEGAPRLRLPPVPVTRAEKTLPYEALFRQPGAPPETVTLETLGSCLRHALGLSAWKEAGGSRWALRVNPSSGNLHPTEGYLIVGPVEGLDDSAALYHYDPESHALEQRCRFAPGSWAASFGSDPEQVFLVALSSIPWREAWKYGERAFRYCQHDTGHAIASLRFAAALLGWTATLDPRWGTADVAAALGLDRTSDSVAEELEEAECLLVVGAPGIAGPGGDDIARLVAAITGGSWSGTANRLSDGHVPWPVVDAVAAASRAPSGGTDAGRNGLVRARPAVHADDTNGGVPEPAPMGPAPDSRHPHSPSALPVPRPAGTAPEAARIILQRRSGVAFNPRATMPRPAFLSILQRLQPASAPPWDSLWWLPAIDLVLFVHRVDDLAPGIYLLARRGQTAAELATRGTWSGGPRAVATLSDPIRPVQDCPGLFLLAEGDVRRLAADLSCGQAIAGDSVFSLGMLATFRGPITRHGAWFYRNLFWEAGVIGQVLYLEAEAHGYRGTGIGCYYDDAVHEVLGLEGDGVQSLYHFTVGRAIEDRRLTTSPGYAWESVPFSPPAT